MDNLYKISAAAAGAVISFFTGIPVIMWVLIAMMTLDYLTGLMTGMMGVSSKTEGGKLSSRAAFDGLMRKIMIFLVVILSVLVDLAVQYGAGVTFNAVTGATCLWGSPPRMRGKAALPIRNCGQAVDKPPSGCQTSAPCTRSLVHGSPRPPCC